MKKNLQLGIQKLESAFLKLSEGVASARDELDRDGVIQRFEFTFELLWKALKIFLEHQGIDVKTPRDSLKEAFRVDLIEDEETVLDMLEDRNRTTHVYDKEESEQIFKRIKSRYIQAIEKVLDELMKKVQDIEDL